VKNRDFNDPEYIKWRKQVFRRDGYKCRMPNCCGKKLEAHHIDRWVDNPLLRYEVANGITLCKQHHKLVTGRELEFKPFLLNLLLGQTDLPTDSFFDMQRRLYGD
jgi:hypothetical protein